MIKNENTYSEKMESFIDSNKIKVVDFLMLAYGTWDIPFRHIHNVTDKMCKQLNVANLDNVYVFAFDIDRLSLNGANVESVLCLRVIEFHDLDIIGRNMKEATMFKVMLDGEFEDCK